MKNKRGFTIIELSVFLAVLGIIASLIALSYSSLLRSSSFVSMQNIANHTATKCLDFYIGEKFINGFNSNYLNLASPSIPPMCIAPAGYTVATLVEQEIINGDNQNYKKVTVTVAKAPNLDLPAVSAKLSTVVAKY